MTFFGQPTPHSQQISYMTFVHVVAGCFSKLTELESDYVPYNSTSVTNTQTYITQISNNKIQLIAKLIL